jgi:hypothetical protein
MFKIWAFCSSDGCRLRAALDQGAAGNRVGHNQQQEQQTGGGGGRISRVTCGQKVTEAHQHQSVHSQSADSSLQRGGVLVQHTRNRSRRARKTIKSAFHFIYKFSYSQCLH